MGYSVDLFGNIVTAGIFVSFDSFQQNAWGLQLSMPLLGKVKGSREVSITVGY